LASSTYLAQSLSAAPRHSGFVRLTHWITALCLFALLVSGLEIVISHPRFYWGEAGNSLSKPLFQIPIPASRATVPTGYTYTLPDQNGWSRSLHFQSAWFAVFTGLAYFIYGLFSGHFRRNLVPNEDDLWTSIVRHLRFEKPVGESYNVVQRLTYLLVIFGLFPLMIWTGVAMSPAFTSAFPFTAAALGGRQSARTIHFFVTFALTLFLLIHVAMVWRAGFRKRVRAMILPEAEPEEDQ
jgi:thiosulfate reductase cytochrome b subunit